MSEEHEFHKVAELTVIGLLLTKVVAEHLRRFNYPGGAFVEWEAWSNAALEPVLAELDNEDLKAAIRRSLKSHLKEIRQVAFANDDR